MKSLISILLIFTSLLSCNEDNFKMVSDQTNTGDTLVFDSIYYHQLNKAYKENDSSMLIKFFEIWHDSSVNNSNTINQTTRVLQNIFNEVYHPFEFEKYGWLPSLYFSKYKYVVLPNKIKFKIVKNLGSYKNSIDLDFDSIDFDSIKPFFTTPNIESAKIIFDIEPFKTSMQLFLNKSGHQKLFYLDTNKIIMNSISFDGKGYLTPPEILGVLINEQLDSSIVDLRLISTGIRINLRKEKGKWKMKEVKELRIEWSKIALHILKSLSIILEKSI